MEEKKTERGECVVQTTKIEETESHSFFTQEFVVGSLALTGAYLIAHYFAGFILIHPAKRWIVQRLCLSSIVIPAVTIYFITEGLILRRDGKGLLPATLCQAIAETTVLSVVGFAVAWVARWGLTRVLNLSIEMVRRGPFFRGLSIMLVMIALEAAVYATVRELIKFGVINFYFQRKRILRIQDLSQTIHNKELLVSVVFIGTTFSLISGLIDVHNLFANVPLWEAAASPDESKAVILITFIANAFTGHHWFYVIPVDCFTGLIIASKLLTAGYTSACGVLWLPVLLQGGPQWVSSLSRIVVHLKVYNALKIHPGAVGFTDLPNEVRVELTRWAWRGSCITSGAMALALIFSCIFARLCYVQRLRSPTRPMVVDKDATGVNEDEATMFGGVFSGFFTSIRHPRRTVPQPHQA